MDHKRFICRESNARFSSKMESEFNEGRIVPFSVLFSETACLPIISEDKRSKDIIQFGFLVSDCEGKLLLTCRAKFSDKKQAGHAVSVGDSVLIGWSPVSTILGNHPYPMSDDDILWAYHHEVRDSHLRKAQVHFLGLVLNEVKAIRYYFYVFQVQYNEKEPDLKGLLKDKHDILCVYYPADDSLIERVSKMKTDLRALELYTKRDLGKFGMGNSRVVPFDPRTKPPFRIHAPDVFISHAKEDDETAGRIAEALSFSGLTCWADHSSLEVGDWWFKEIEAGIKYGGCFVLLCSRKSHESKGVRDEVRLAIERQSRYPGYPILLVVLEGACIEEFIPKEFLGLQAQDFRQLGSRSSAIHGLVGKVKEALPWLAEREGS